MTHHPEKLKAELRGSVAGNLGDLIDYDPDMVAKLLRLDAEAPAATFADDKELMAWLDSK